MGINLKPERPRVLVDARMVGETPHGIAAYVMDISRSIRSLYGRKMTPYELAFLVQECREGADVWHGFETQLSQFEFLSKKEILGLSGEIVKSEASLFHSPSFSSLLKYPCPYVMTVHDLNHLQYGSNSQKIYYQLLLKRAARRCLKLSTVSEFSRQELSSWLRVSPDSIEVISNCVDRPKLVSNYRQTEVLRKYGLESRRYFMTLSNQKPHKNMQVILDAYQSLRQDYEIKPEWPLVLSYGGVEQPGVLSDGPFDQESTDILLHHAGGLLYPSLYEGFGRPPVEATLHGTPIVVSEIPVHREVLRDLGPDEVTFVDPKQKEPWVAAMLKLVKNKGVKAKEETIERVADRYSLAKFGAQMDRYYREALGGDLAGPEAPESESR